MCVKFFRIIPEFSNLTLTLESQPQNTELGCQIVKASLVLCLVHLKTMSI